MLPEMLRVPYFGWTIKSYGMMLMLGFFVCVWYAMRRATRVKADPDLILNIGFVALVCGVLGARAFFVAHYWGSTFAPQENPWLEAINLTSGGLEYYGGLLCAIAGAVVYLRFFARFPAVVDNKGTISRRKPSLRLYLDILAPAAMYGLAFGRAGCFLNGCCWGGVCVHSETPSVHEAGARAASFLPWSVQFPFGSPSQQRQWENRQVAVPAELIFDHPINVNAPFLLYPASLDAPVDEVEWPRTQFENVEREIAAAERAAKESGQSAVIDPELAAKREKALTALEQAQGKHFTVYRAMMFPSRADPSRPTTRTELVALANQFRSLPVHPVQLYGLINAVLLGVMLSRLFYRRKRHGIVFAWMCVIYPITRIVLEWIRVDNPTDVVGLTISQAVSLGMFLFGVVVLFVLTRPNMPDRSVRALPYALPEPLPERVPATA